MAWVSDLQIAIAAFPEPPAFYAGFPLQDGSQGHHHNSGILFDFHLPTDLTGALTSGMAFGLPPSSHRPFCLGLQMLLVSASGGAMPPAAAGVTHDILHPHPLVRYIYLYMCIL